MAAVLAIIAMIISVLLTVLVLVQNSKGGGLSGTFGASQISSMIGQRRATQDVEKLTWYLAGGLMIFAFFANIFVGSGEIDNQGSRMKNQINDGVPAMNTPPPQPIDE